MIFLVEKVQYFYKFFIRIETIFFDNHGERRLNISTKEIVLLGLSEARATKSFQVDVLYYTHKVNTYFSMSESERMKTLTYFDSHLFDEIRLLIIFFSQT